MLSNVHKIFSKFSHANNYTRTFAVNYCLADFIMSAIVLSLKDEIVGCYVISIKKNQRQINYFVIIDFRIKYKENVSNRAKNVNIIFLYFILYNTGRKKSEQSII